MESIFILGVFFLAAIGIGSIAYLASWLLDTFINFWTSGE